MKKNYNKYTFGLGTVGRDMVYSMVSMYLMFYLTDILELSTGVSDYVCCSYIWRGESALR